MANENALKVSELAKLLQKGLGEWNIIAGDDCGKSLANVCFDYIGPKLEDQLREYGSFETVRD